MPWLNYVSSGGAPEPVVVYFGERTSSGLPTSGAAQTARDAFMARLSVSGVIDFDDDGFTEFDTLDGAALSCNGVTATFSTVEYGPSVIMTSSGGLYPISGTAYAQMYLCPTVMVFDTAVAAFGFWMTDAGDESGRVSVVLTKSGGGTDTYEIAHSLPASAGYLCFWGVVVTDRTYTQASIEISDPDEAIGVDDIVLATSAQLN
jgi:hypothetical protein